MHSAVSISRSSRLSQKLSEIIATILGLFLQLRPDIVQMERAAHRSLNSSVNMYATEVSKSIRTLKAFQTESAQHLDEYTKNLLALNKDETTEFKKWLDGYLKTSSEKIYFFK